jgi:hypothetical protein
MFSKEILSVRVFLSFLRSCFPNYLFADLSRDESDDGTGRVRF